MDISLVIPLYNEAESLPELTAWIERVMDKNGFSYEILFILSDYKFLFILVGKKFRINSGFLFLCNFFLSHFCT